MPSESTKRCNGSTILKQSSLLERTRPTSVTPPLAIRTRTPLPPEITPLPTPIPGDSVPTLTEPQGPRKALNPTDYSLFRNTEAVEVIRLIGSGRTARLRPHYSLVLPIFGELNGQ